MLVREWMTIDPAAVSPDTSVLEARAILHHLGVRHLPVVDGGWLAGIVSDRDLATDDDVPVRAVMSSPVHTASPRDDLRAVARLLLSRHIHGVPVVDTGGFLVGMVTTTDCLLALLHDEAIAEAHADPLAVPANVR